MQPRSSNVSPTGGLISSSLITGDHFWGRLRPLLDFVRLNHGAAGSSSINEAARNYIR